MEAKSPVSLTDQEITHVELNLKNASQESLSNDMSRHCKGKNFLPLPVSLFKGVVTEFQGCG